ncbi:MAG: hypothetical protein ACKPKO_63495 [Candidatus Fonsibacter sp.]
MDKTVRTKKYGVERAEKKPVRTWSSLFKLGCVGKQEDAPRVVTGEQGMSDVRMAGKRVVEQREESG